MTFRVYGIAQPKGSTRAFLPRGMKFPIVTDSNRSARSWSQLVAEGVSHELQSGRFPFQDGAVRVDVAFALPRPKAIKARALPHLRKPDVDKLARCVLDALSGVLFRDDAQVVDLHVTKRYAAFGVSPHAVITVEPTSGLETGDLFERQETCRL